MDAHGENDLSDHNTVLYGDGRKSYAADFERDESEFLSVADNEDFSLGDQDFTLGGWVKAESLAGSNKYIFAKQDAYRLYYDSTADRLKFTVTGGTSVTPDSAPSTDTWYFVVVWHDSVNDQIAMQVNDGTVFTTAHSTGVTDNDHDFALGGYVQSGSGSDQWDGLIDEFFFYSRVLTADECAWLYNGGAGRTYSNLPSTPSGDGWLARIYSYDSAHPHAVASVTLPDVSTDTYEYDLNGNTLAPHSRRTPGRCAFGAVQV